MRLLLYIVRVEEAFVVIVNTCLRLIKLLDRFCRVGASLTKESPFPSSRNHRTSSIDWMSSPKTRLIITLKLNVLDLSSKC